jgi:hypothetical protein
MAAELGRVPPEGLGCRCPSNFGFLGLCAHRGFACTQRFASHFAPHRVLARVAGSDLNALCDDHLIARNAKVMVSA